eukprot:gene11641-biopygen5012
MGRRHASRCWYLRHAPFPRVGMQAAAMERGGCGRREGRWQAQMLNRHRDRDPSRRSYPSASTAALSTPVLAGACPRALLARGSSPHYRRLAPGSSPHYRLLAPL